MSENTYNNYVCDGLVTTATNIENALFNTDFSGLDENGIVYSEITENWDNTWTTPEQVVVDALEGPEKANEICRLLYELNSIADVQETYCCQTIYMALMEDGASGLLNSATSMILSLETITLTGPDDRSYELSYGAALFNVPEPETEEEEEGATSVATSVVAIAASFMVYLQ